MIISCDHQIVNHEIVMYVKYSYHNMNPNVMSTCYYTQLQLPVLTVITLSPEKLSDCQNVSSSLCESYRISD